MPGEGLRWQVKNRQMRIALRIILMQKHSRKISPINHSLTGQGQAYPAASNAYEANVMMET